MLKGFAIIHQSLRDRRLSIQNKGQKHKINILESNENEEFEDQRTLIYRKKKTKTKTKKLIATIIRTKLKDERYGDLLVNTY